MATKTTTKASQNFLSLPNFVFQINIALNVFLIVYYITTCKLLQNNKYDP